MATGTSDRIAKSATFSRDELMLAHAAALAYWPRHVEKSDWIQRVFLQIWRKRHLYKPELGAWSTWSYRVARQCRFKEIYRHNFRLSLMRQRYVGDFDIVCTKWQDDGDRREIVRDVRYALRNLLPMEHIAVQAIMDGVSLSSVRGNRSRAALSQAWRQAKAELAIRLRKVGYE